MTAVTNIVLADAQATPVNHTFVPLGPDRNGVWQFEDQSASSPIGYWRVSVSLKRPVTASAGEVSGSERVSRATIQLSQPVLETLGTNAAGISPPPTVSYVPRCRLEFIMPERGSLQNRKDLRKMGMNVLNDASIVALLESLQNLY